MDKYFAEALRIYEQGIDRDEHLYMDAPILVQIEEYYEKENRPYDAERCMRFALRLHPEDQEVLLTYAYRLKCEGQWWQAEKVIRDLPDQQHRDVLLFYAEKKVSEGMVDEAEQDVRRHISGLTGNELYDWWLDVGEIMLDYGYCQRAAAWLEPIPPTYPEMKRVHELLADIYIQLERTDEAIAQCNAQIDADPYDAVSWVQLADLHQKCGQLEECVEACDYALAIDESNQQALSIKAFAVFAQGKTEEGMALCREHYDPQSNDFTIPMYMGEHLYMREQFDEALPLLRHALRCCPTHHADRMRIITGLACVHVALDQTAAAMTMMEQSVPYHETFTMACTRVAEFLLGTHVRQQAVQMLVKVAIPASAKTHDTLRIAEMLHQHEYYAEVQPLWDILQALAFRQKDYELLALTTYGVYRSQPGILSWQLLEQLVQKFPRHMAALLQLPVSDAECQAVHEAFLHDERYPQPH